MKRTHLLFLATGLSLVASPVFSEDTSPRWFILGGLDAGYSWLSANAPSEVSKHGWQGQAKLLASVEFPKVAVDLGMGWMTSHLAGDGDSGNFRHVNMDTKSGLAELSPRYRFTPRLAVGPLVDFLFGTDVSFAQSLESQNQRTAFLAGAQALYDLPTTSEKMRVGLRYTTDLSASGRSVNALLLSFQIGLPIGHSEQPTERYESSSSENQCVIVEKSNELTVSLGVQMLQFETGSSELSANSKTIAQELGSFLAANSGIWEKLQIDGHTDQRGSFEYNLKLSQGRASSVKEALVSAGVTPESRLIPRGFSMVQPIDPESNPKAWAINRRVELHFTGVKDSTKIREELLKLEQMSGGQQHN